MARWYERAFDAIGGELGRAVSDVRAKLIEEGFFGRKVPEPFDRGEGLPLTLDGQEEKSLLDRFYETDPELFIAPSDRYDPDRVRDTATLSFADQLGWARDSGPAARAHQNEHEIEH